MNIQQEKTEKLNIQKPTSPFRSFVLVLGICLCIIAYKSHRANGSQQAYDNNVVQQVNYPVNTSPVLRGSQAALDQNNASKSMNSGQNFIFTYLLQESSFQRSKKIPYSQGSFARHIKDIHQYIMSASLLRF